ncbi:MAG: hypothetical protein ABW149_13025 [Sedimenticola sp.]
MSEAGTKLKVISNNRCYLLGFDEGLFGDDGDTSSASSLSEDEILQWLDGWVCGSLIKTTMELKDLQSE